LSTKKTMKSVWGRGKADITPRRKRAQTKALMVTKLQPLKSEGGRFWQVKRAREKKRRYFISSQWVVLE